MTTQFGDKYRAWARITKATMRIHHKPGDAMQVDWAGDTLSVYDSMTGEITPAYLFIAVLARVLRYKGIDIAFTITRLQKNFDSL